VRTLFKKGLDGKPLHPGASTNMILKKSKNNQVKIEVTKIKKNIFDLYM